MAKTIVNLSDQISTWLTKTNTISSDLGDVAALLSGDSNVVDAINTLISDPGVDSAQVISIVAAFLDGGAGIDFDSAEGTFSLATGGIDSSMLANDAVSADKLKDLVTLVIYDSDGSTLKTLYGAGS